MTRPLRGPLRKRKSHLWKRSRHDFYVEPKWVSERLFEVEKFDGDVWDPACGLGRIVQSAQKAGPAFGTDIVKRSRYCANVFDFLDAYWRYPFARGLVSNPPFAIAEKFVEAALNGPARKIAMLLPANWVQGDKRSRWLATTPLFRVYFISPRPSMPPGSVVRRGGKPGNGTTDYCWMIWLKGFDGPVELRWLRRDP